MAEDFMPFVVNHWPGLVAGYFGIGLVFTIWLFTQTWLFLGHERLVKIMMA